MAVPAVAVRSDVHPTLRVEFNDGAPRRALVCARVGMGQDDVRRPATTVTRRVCRTVRHWVALALPLLAHAAWAATSQPISGARASPDPAPIDIQRARAVRQHSGRDRPGQGFTGHDDRLRRGLERGTPALPALRVGCGGGGDGLHSSVIRAASVDLISCRRAVAV